jgi:hypothetical protein
MITYQEWGKGGSDTGNSRDRRDDPHEEENVVYKLTVKNLPRSSSGRGTFLTASRLACGQIYSQNIPKIGRFIEQAVNRPWHVSCSIRLGTLFICMVWKRRMKIPEGPHSSVSALFLEPVKSLISFVTKIKTI